MGSAEEAETLTLLLSAGCYEEQAGIIILTPIDNLSVLAPVLAELLELKNFAMSPTA